jgi:hypothetical protein
MKAKRGIVLFSIGLLVVALAAAIPESCAAGKSKKDDGRAGSYRNANYRRIPAGSDIIVRVDRDILMRNARVGEIYTMTLDREVIAGNEVVVRRGERAEVRLYRPEGRSDEVAFHLISMTVDGFVYDVNSDIAREYAQRETDGLNVLGKTAIGAATGAALGAIAGGGRGAAIGAGAGAGAGLIWSAATMRDARLPAGTRLRFSLLDPVILNN